MATALGCSLPPCQLRSARSLCLFNGDGDAFLSCGRQYVRSPAVLCNPSCRGFQVTVPGERFTDSRQRSGLMPEREMFDGDASSLIHVQTLRNFPKEKLKGEVVAVRVDSSLMLDASCTEDAFGNKALYTIKYLYDAGAKVILLSSWDHSSDPILASTRSFAEHLSSILQLNVLPANGGQLKVEELRRADIFLFENLTRFKGEELYRLISIAEATKRPFIAIIGGGNFLEKASALYLLALKCDGLMFVGKMAFLVMHALGMTVPMNLVEYDAVGQVLELIQLVKNRNVEIFFPDDFWCMDNKHPEIMDIFPNDGILPGWTPIGLGPVSFQNISSRLSKCKKVLLIGPINTKISGHDVDGVFKMCRILDRISENGCEVVVVGNASYKTFFRRQRADSFLLYKHFENASVVWEFLKGQKLPAIAALDREMVCSFLEWLKDGKLQTFLGLRLTENLLPVVWIISSNMA